MKIHVSLLVGQACASFLRFSMIITSFVLSRFTKHFGTHPAGSNWETKNKYIYIKGLCFNQYGNIYINFGLHADECYILFILIYLNDVSDHTWVIFKLLHNPSWLKQQSSNWIILLGMQSCCYLFWQWSYCHHLQAPEKLRIKTCTLFVKASNN